MTETVTLTAHDTDDNRNVTISYDANGTIQQALRNVREFLLAFGFTDETVSKYITSEDCYD